MSKVALVTGALKGIGKAISDELLNQGIIVYVNYRDSDKNKEIINNTPVHPNRRYIAADLLDEEAIKLMIETIKKQEGKLDILVNNAGITNDKLVLRMKQEDFTKVIDTNLTGTFLCSKYASKAMMKQNAGKIISISSVVGVHGNSGQANYAASKAGIIGLSKTLAKELGKKNIQVNVVAPGFINTDMTKVLPEELKTKVLDTIPLNRFGEDKEIASLVAFLASDKANYITGQVIEIDGGMGI